MQPFIRVTYASEMRPSLRRTDLKSILLSAQHNNKLNDISGVLAFTNGNFFQLLEGPREKVNSTLEKIYRDDRHKRIQMLQATDIEEASFPEWAMMWMGEHFTIRGRGVYSASDWIKFDGKTIEYELISMGLRFMRTPNDSSDAEVLI